MFVSSSKYRNMKEQAAQAAASAIFFKNERDRMIEKWNALVRRINAKGGMDFLERAALNTPSQFNKDDLQRLIQLCHPDKHDGKDMAKEMTVKLVKMKESMK